MTKPEPQARPDGGGSTSRTTSFTLINSAKSDDQDAWTRLVDLYTPLVAHWCHRWGVDTDDVDDVLQEVFQAVAVGLKGFRRDSLGGTFRGWLRGIARHKVMDRFRCRSPRSEGGTEFSDWLAAVPDVVDSGGDDDGMRDVFRRAFEVVRGEFEPRTWDLFWRTAIEGTPPDLVAAQFGVSPGAVRQAKSRVLRRLKLVLGEATDWAEFTHP